MDKVATIRKYQPKDYENLRTVCDVTATGSYVGKKDITAALFCEHYLLHEAEHCFVVADKDDNAVGYIICAPDYNKFVKEFKKYQMPKVRKLSKNQVLKMRLEFLFTKLLFRKYPAHLHINILEDYQRMGLGHKLINELMLHLDSIGVKSLHLGCNAENPKGVNFYKKIGFHIIRTAPGSIIFGIYVHDYAEKLRKEQNV